MLVLCLMKIIDQNSGRKPQNEGIDFYIMQGTLGCHCLCSLNGFMRNLGMKHVSIIAAGSESVKCRVYDLLNMEIGEALN